MYAYYLTLITVFFFSLLADLFKLETTTNDTPLKKLPYASRACLFITAAALIFVAGSRYYVGTDFGAYYRGLKTYAPKLGSALRTFNEPGLPLLATIVRWFTKDGAWFIMACSFLTIGLILLTTYRYEHSFLMSSLLFILTIWDGTFNGVRQYLAAAILFTGHRYVYDKKFWKWLIVVFLAAAVHKTALVMAVLYFILRNKVSMRNIILLTIGTYLVSANYDTIFSFIGFLSDSEMTMSSYATRTVNVLRTLVSCAPAILCLIVNANKKLTDEETFYTNALVVHGAAMVAASNSAYLARIGIYTSSYVVIGLPKLLRTNNKYMDMILRGGSIILYAIFWYFEMSGSSDLNQYQFVWTAR